MSDQQQRKVRTEELKIQGDALLGKVKELAHESNAAIIIMDGQGKTLIEVLLSVGVVGAFVAPVAAAVGAIAARRRLPRSSSNGATRTVRSPSKTIERPRVRWPQPTLNRLGVQPIRRGGEVRSGCTPHGVKNSSRGVTSSTSWLSRGSTSTTPSTARAMPTITWIWLSSTCPRASRCHPQP